jgi:hypothetical protein
MKKALLGRRLFASLMPAAPAIVGEVGRGVAEKLVTDSSLVGDTIRYGTMNMTRPRLDPPATYAKYQEAEEALMRVRRFRHQKRRLLSDCNAIDLNIMALKSVSLQHKAVMHLRQEEQESLRNRTFMENLADALGLRDFFKKRDELRGDDPYPTASAGY